MVEDEPLISMDAAHMLEAAGFTVIEACNADEAISLLETTPRIWAIFTDIDMPGSMDGMRLAFAVKDRWPPVHIFVTSGHRDIDVSALPSGGQFFQKPYDPVSLIAAFRETQGIQ